MRIKISDDIYADSRTLFRLEWRNYLPVLIVHEKFESKIKWTLRIIAAIGIGTSLISIDSKLASLGLALAIFLVEQFLERTVFEYTTMVVLPLPDFDIDYSQWKTNGFLLPATKNDGVLCHVGPTYANKEYAIKFFNYIKSWNGGLKEDKDNNIVLSFVLEPNEKYTTYLYPSPNQKDLDALFNQAAKDNEVKKYGKNQQQLIMQTIFWNTLDFKNGSFSKRFFDFQDNNTKFYLTPSVIPSSDGRPVAFLLDLAVLKNGYKLKKREEITKQDIEYYFLPKK